VVFTSQTNANEAGLSNTVLGTNTVTLSGTVFNYAQAAMGASTITYQTNSGSQTLTLGNIHQGGSFTATNLAVTNSATGVDGYVETLASAFGASNNASGSGTFTGLATNGVGTLLLSLGNTNSGSNTGSIAVVFTSQTNANEAGLSNTVLGTNTVTLSGFVYTGQSTWTAGTGNWTNFANWSALGGTPGLDGSLSANDAATFGTGAGGTVTLSTNAQLNALAFSNASAYTITGTGTISLVQGSSAPSITTTLGSHTISNALTFGTNVTVTNASNTLLTLGGSIGGSGSLAKSGLGTLSLTGSNSYSGGTAVNGGTLAVANSNALAAGSLTLTNGSLNSTLLGTLSVSSLVMNGDASISLTSAGSAFTNISVTSFTNNNSGNLISLASGSTWAGGTNTLIFSSVPAYYTGLQLDLFGSQTISLGGTTNISNKTYTFTSNASSLQLLIQINASDLYWAGGASGNWNTTTNVWSTNAALTGTFQAFSTNDNATFGSTATITVTNSGITAGTVMVTNTTGTVTLAGGTLTASSLTKTNAGAFVASNNLALGSGTFLNSGSGNATIAGSILSGAVTQSGSGTTILSGNNSYSGTTTISGGKLLLNGTNSGGAITVSGGIFGGTGKATNSAVALSGSGTITPGNGSTTGTLSIGSLTITGGTLNILLGGSSTSLLAVNGNASLGGTLNFSTNATLTSTTYTFLTYTGSLSGTFATTNALPTGYQLVYGTNSVYLQALAGLGPITTSFGGGTNAIITGGSTNFFVGVTNTAAAGAANMVFTGTTVTNTTGSIGSTTLSPQTGTNVTGLAFNGANVGLNQTGTFTVSSTNATPSSGTGTVTVNVYDHASGSLSTSNVALSNVIVGYSNAVTTNVGVSNSSGTRVALGSGSVTSSNNVTLSGVTNVLAGTSSNAVLTFSTNQGVGAFTNTIAVTYADASTLNGASNNLGSQTLTVTGAVYDHAAGSIGSTNLNLSNWITGYTGSVASTNSVVLTNTSGLRVNLGATNTSGLVGSVASLTNGGSTNLTANIASATNFGSGTGTFSSNVAITLYDASTLAGAQTNGTTNVQVSGSVYGHAAGSLSSNAVVLSNVIVGYTSTQTNNIGVSNAAGFRVALSMMTNAPASNNVSFDVSGVTNVVQGTSSNAVLTFSTNQVVGGFTNRISLVYGDVSSLAGASTNVGTGTLTLTGAVYDHAAGSLTNSNVVFAVHVGNSNTQTALVGMSNAVGFRVSMATLATNSSNGLSLAGVTNVVSGTSSNAILTYSNNNGVVTSFTNQIGVVYGDASSYDGASSAVGTNMLTVNGYVYSGQSTWTAGSGNWSNFTNWTALGGTPGLDGALSTNDTATFGTGGGGVVTLSTNAVLNALTFSNASSYTIAGTGTISLEQGSSAPSIMTLQGSHTISNALTLSTNVIVTNASGTMLTLSGSIGGAGILTNSGSGTLMLASSNSYTGGTVLNGGKVAIANASSFGTGAITFANNATVAALTTNLLVTNNYTIAGSATGTFEVGAGLNFDNSGLISGGSLAKIGAGTLTLSTLNAYTNGTFIYDGTLVVNATNALGTGAVTITNGALLDFSIVGSGAVTNTLIGNGVVVTTGAGTLTLGDSTTNFTGTIGAADGGILRLTNTNSVGMATNLLLDGGTLRISGDAASNSISNTITVASNSSGVIEHGTGTGTLTLAGTLVKNAATLTLMGTNTGDITISGSITGDSANSDLIYNFRIFNVTGSNTYNGPTYLISNAIVNALSNYALPTANGRSAVYLDQTNTGAAWGSGSSILNLGTNQTIASLSGLASSSVNLSNSILTIGTNSGNTTFAGNISGAGGSLVKDGASTLTLSGSNTYVGGTTITNSGAIIAASSNALGSGNLTLGASGKLILDSMVSIGSLIWNSASATIGFTSITNGYYLNVTNAVALSGPTNYFDMSGFDADLNTTPIQILGFGTNTLSASQFGVLGLAAGTQYELTTSNSALLIALSGPIGAQSLFWSGAANNIWSTNRAYTNWQTNAGVSRNVAFYTGDNATLGNAATNAVITVTNSGVTAGSVNVNNTGGTVTLGGGTITATNYFAKTELGSLVIATNGGVSTPLLLVSNNALMENRGQIQAAELTITNSSSMTNLGSIKSTNITVGTLSKLENGASNNTNATILVSQTLSIKSKGEVNNYGAITANTLLLDSSGSFNNYGNITTTSTNGTIVTNDIIYQNIGQVTYGNINITSTNASYYSSGTNVGSVTNVGHLGPGYTNANGNFIPATMTIDGNLTLLDTDPLEIHISGNSYGKLVVTPKGTAALDGFVNIHPQVLLSYGEQFTNILTAGLINGGFNRVNVYNTYNINQLSPVFRGRLITNSTSVSLVIAPTSYTLLAQNQNQTNVARALDTFIPATSGDKKVVSTALDELTASQYQTAFNAIMPTMYQSLGTIAFNLANAQNSELAQRLWNQRVAESGGFSMSGFADNTPIWEGQGDGAGIMDPNKDILRPGPDNRWGLFLDGNGIFAQANSGNMLPTYNAQSGGMTVGVTYRVNPVLSVGAYTGYEGTYAKYNAGSTLIDNSVRFGLFATYGKVDNRGFYLSAMLGGGYNQYQVTRNIQFSGINRTANSQPGAGELDTMLAGGYNIRKGNWTFGPTTSLQYTYLNVNGFNETGAQSLNLTSGGWNTASMLGSLGAQAAYTWQATKNLVVVPQISASWQHEFMQNPYAINSSMGGVNFSNLSSAPLRDFLYTGIGVTLEFKQRWFTSIFYNAAAGNNDLQSQNIFWSFGCKF
jgi:autotransporter-associated beta strand protein